MGNFSNARAVTFLNVDVQARLEFSLLYGVGGEGKLAVAELEQ